MKPGDELTLSITDIARGGAGVAKSDDGRVIFVPFTITSEIVTAKIVEINQRHAIAELITVKTPSPLRLTPRCEVFGQCGGCQWQHLPYALQWDIKLKGIQQALSAAGIKTKIGIESFPADTHWHYRNRIQLRGYGEKIGYYAARSHDLIPIEHCPIAHETINSGIAQARQEGEKLNNSYKVEIETDYTNTVQFYWNQEHAAGGFRQINDEQNLKLQHWVTDKLQHHGLIYDLYGGSGNLSKQSAARGAEVHCVDRYSPMDTHASNLHFHPLDVLPWLKQRITDLIYKRISYPHIPPAAIIDPPRGGLGNEFDDIISRLEKLNVENMLLVGCKTDTWARDIAKLQTRGWTIESIAALDFFPHTPHVETVAQIVK